MGRRRLANLLSLVPARPLRLLRTWFVSVPPGSRRQRALGLLLELVRHRGIPEDGGAFALPDEPSVRFAVADSVVLQRVYWMGREGWEPELATWWPVLCRSAHGVLELGANVGYYTVRGALAAPGVAYRAVEPHPATASVLRRNLALNSCTGVEVIEAAAVPAGGAEFVELLVPEFDHFATPAGALVADRSEIERAGRVVVPVASVPVTSLIGGVDLLKLDVEGQEHELLQAMRAHLEAHRPTICVELLARTPLLRELLVELCDRCGYTILTPTRDRLRVVPVAQLRTVRLDERLETRDVILTAAPALVGLATAAAGPPTPD